jgi:CRISPR-associated protein Cmr5
MVKTLAQQRSEFALEGVKTFPGDRDKFKKLAAGLPAMILQNGFGQTLAFLLAKGKGEHIQAFDLMIRWLENRRVINDRDRGKAMESISIMSQKDYLYAQEEAMQVVEWVKRYANADLFSS